MFVLDISLILRTKLAIERRFTKNVFWLKHILTKKSYLNISKN